MLINNLLFVAPLFLHLHSVVTGALLPLGWGEKKPPCAFLDFSTHACVPRAWITDENVKYDENSGKTCLMCLSIKTDCKTCKESSREEVGEKRHQAIFFCIYWYVQRWHSSALPTTVIFHQEGPISHFWPKVFLCWVSMFPLCLCWFHSPKTCGLGRQRALNWT